jgi:hypothetical protein
VVARVQGGGRREDLLADARQLRSTVRSLREELAQGGTVAPPPIDQVLITLDTARR